MTDHHGDSRLRQELSSRERVLWSGRPDPTSALTAEWPAFPFALLWMGTLLTGYVKNAPGSDPVYLIFFITFLLVGLVILWIPLRAYRSAGLTRYALTDERLIVLRSGKRQEITSLRRSGIKHVERKPARGGRATLSIPLATASDGDGGTKAVYLHLHGLADGDRLFRLLTH